MSLRGKRILIVEDNTLNRVVFQITLGGEGAFLEFDRSGEEAIEKLKRSSKWDLIILDLKFHNGISGFDIFRAIRKVRAYDHIPVIAVSALDPSIAMPMARQLGFSGFISKPVDEVHFGDQIACVIAGENIWNDGTDTLAAR